MSAVLDVGNLPSLDLHMDDAFGVVASGGICGEDALFPSFVAETSVESAATRLPSIVRSSSNSSKQDLVDGSTRATSFTGGRFHGFCEYQDLPSTLYNSSDTGAGLLHDGSHKAIRGVIPCCEPHRETGSDLIDDFSRREYSVPIPTVGDSSCLSIHPTCGAETNLRTGSEEASTVGGHQTATQLLYSFPLGTQPSNPVQCKFTPISFGEVVQPALAHQLGGSSQNVVGTSYKPSLTIPLLEPSLTSGQGHWVTGELELR